MMRADQSPREVPPLLFLAAPIPVVSKRFHIFQHSIDASMLSALATVLIV
jgi:hypothetical protein